MKRITKPLIFKLIAVLITVTTSYAQQMIGKEILKAKTNNIAFQKIDYSVLKKKSFKPVNSIQLASYYEYDSNTFKKTNNNLEYLSMPIQTTDGKSWVLDLKKNIRKNIRVTSTNNSYKFFNNSKKESYIGVIRGKEEESLVCLIFTNEEVKGFISLNGEGVFEIGKLKNSNTHILYNSSQQESVTPDFLCKTEYNNHNHHEITINNKKASLKPEQRPCIGVQAVVDYNIFTGAGGSDLVKTINYIEDFYTQVFAIFYNEGINMNLNDIYVHTSEQTYTSPLRFVREDDSYTRKGDLIQLLRNTTYMGMAGAASTGSICSTYGYSWSKLDGAFGDYPIYTFNIQAAAHEFGHNLGAAHLFSCTWNNDLNYQSGDNVPGGNNRITNCATNGSSCSSYQGSNPYTVMSYCGRYLAFTPQASDIMRMNIDRCTEKINTGCIEYFLSSNQNYTKQEKDVIIYPNPVSNNLQIKSDSYIDKISLKDLTGKTIKIISGKSQVDMSRLSSGIYILVIESKDKISVKRILRK